jgi:SAM-dependent methyltransferase
MRELLRYLVGIVLAAYIILQARKPTKWFGRYFLMAMSEGHSRLTDWGLSHVGIEGGFTILDVGCGGGRTIKKMAAMAKEGVVYGVDYAEGSVAASRATNADLIKAGRVFIEKASVSKLPFPDNKFDLVTAVETQYYWPNLVEDMREILRVLKPGGKLVVTAEMYKGGAGDKLKWPVMWLLRSSHLSVEDERRLFAEGGYAESEIFEEKKRGWICAVGTKSAQSSAGAT